MNKKKFNSILGGITIVDVAAIGLIALMIGFLVAGMIGFIVAGKI